MYVCAEIVLCWLLCVGLVAKREQDIIIGLLFSYVFRELKKQNKSLIKVLLGEEKSFYRM